MNTILILTAKSRAAEKKRDEQTLRRARALNRGTSGEIVTTGGVRSVVAVPAYQVTHRCGHRQIYIQINCKKAARLAKGCCADCIFDSHQTPK